MRIKIVEEQVKGDYWPILKSKIEQWIENANKRSLDMIKDGITEKNMGELNFEMERIKTFELVLKINEAIIYENKTWLDRIKEPLSQAVNYVKTFVGYGREGRGKDALQE